MHTSDYAKPIYAAIAETAPACFRRSGKTETMAHMIIEAIREDLSDIEMREKIFVKQTWNTNRQRNLHHYPGRRWIDKRTTNK